MSEDVTETEMSMVLPDGDRLTWTRRVRDKGPRDVVSDARGSLAGVAIPDAELAALLRRHRDEI